MKLSRFVIGFCAVGLTTVPGSLYAFKFGDVLKSNEGMQAVGSILGKVAKSFDYKEKVKGKTYVTGELNGEFFAIHFPENDGHIANIYYMEGGVPNQMSGEFTSKKTDFYIGDMKFTISEDLKTLDGDNGIMNLSDQLNEIQSVLKERSDAIALKEKEEQEAKAKEKLRTKNAPKIALAEQADALDIKVLKERAKNSGVLNFKGFYLGMPKNEYLALIRNYFPELNVSFDSEGDLVSIDEENKELPFSASFDNDAIKEFEFDKPAMIKFWKRVGDLKKFVQNFVNHYSVPSMEYNSEYHTDLVTNTVDYSADNTDEGYSLFIGEYRKLSNFDMRLMGFGDIDMHDPTVRDMVNAKFIGTKVKLKTIPKASDTFD